VTVLGRYPRPVVDSPVFDAPYNALPGVDQDGFVRSNMPMWAAVANITAVGTGIAIGVPIYLRKGDVVTSLTFVSGGTAAVTLTNWWHALYDTDGVLLAQSADQTSAAWAADTAKKLNLSSPVTVAKDGWYTAATMTAAATVQTMVGAVPPAGTAVAFTGSKAMGRTFGSSLTATAPATISGASPATAAKCPLVIVS
jgi:hypothetical protein